MKKSFLKKGFIKLLKSNIFKKTIISYLTISIFIFIALMLANNFQVFNNINFKTSDFENNFNSFEIVFLDTSCQEIENIEVLGTAVIKNNNQLTNNKNLNNLQSQSANLTEYEGQILNLINNVRSNNGLALLQPNQSLTDIARTRSNDMLQRGYFSHYSPEGKTVLNIMKECGITFRAAGENLAHSKPAKIGTPEAFLNAWMNSPTHAANILRDRYGIIGIGMVENGDRRVVTTVFRNP